MELIIIGSGSSIPINDRASPSMALLVGGRLVIFDMGPGTLRRMSGLGLSFENIDYIFISHFHPDHTADIIHFLFATRNPLILKRRTPFTIAGPTGLRDFLSRLQEVYGKWLDIPTEIMNVEEFDLKNLEKKSYDTFQIISNPSRHTPQSVSYRVESQSGRSMVYSGDTGYCAEIIELSRNCDLLVLECSFPEGEEMEGHLTPSLAGRIADIAGAGKLMLVHFYPETLASNIFEDCRKAFKGELILGRDSLHISI